MILGLLVFSGCAKQIAYVPQEVLVPVPVSCEIPPPKCDHKKVTDTELITEARLCIRRYKAALDHCRYGTILPKP
jgi:hypothetical protein